jgi:hypothetical protein
MGLVLFILLLAVRCQAIDTQKSWSDWLSEGHSFRDAGDYSSGRAKAGKAIRPLFSLDGRGPRRCEDLEGRSIDCDLRCSKGKSW